MLKTVTIVVVSLFITLLQSSSLHADITDSYQTQSQQEVLTQQAPAPLGAYSQAIKTDNIVFIAGQNGTDPKTLQLVQGTNKEIEQAFKNLTAITQAAGGNLSNIVKINIYLTNIVYLPLVDSMMAKYFTKPYPARTAVVVKALPDDAKIEVEAVMIST